MQPSSQSSDPKRALAVSRGASHKDLLRAADDEVSDMRVPAKANKKEGAKKGSRREEIDEDEQVDGDGVEDREMREEITHSDDDDDGGGDDRRSHRGRFVNERSGTDKQEAKQPNDITKGNKPRVGPKDDDLSRDDEQEDPCPTRERGHRPSRSGDGSEIQL